MKEFGWITTMLAMAQTVLIQLKLCDRIIIGWGEVLIPAWIWLALVGIMFVLGCVCAVLVNGDRYKTDMDDEHGLDSWRMP